MAWRNESFDNISIPVPLEAQSHNLIDLLKSYLKALLGIWIIDIMLGALLQFVFMIILSQYISY